MRRVHGPCCKIYEEWFVRRQRLLSFHPVDRLIGHVCRKMVVLHLRRGNASHSVIDKRIPLVRFSANKTVKFVEALMRGPTVKWTGYTGFPRRGLMPFAERAALFPSRESVAAGVRTR